MSESRLCELVAHTPRPAGRTTTTVRCPFCGCSVEARAWSLAGSGKRCECGAVMQGPDRFLILATKREAVKRA